MRARGGDTRGSYASHEEENVCRNVTYGERKMSSEETRFQGQFIQIAIT